MKKQLFILTVSASTLVCAVQDDRYHASISPPESLTEKCQFVKGHTCQTLFQKAVQETLEEQERETVTRIADRIFAGTLNTISDEEYEFFITALSKIRDCSVELNEEILQPDGNCYVLYGLLSTDLDRAIELVRQPAREAKERGYADLF